MARRQVNPRDLDLVIAAVHAVDPCPADQEAAWTDRVRERAVSLYVLGDTVGQDIARLDAAKQFTATLLDVRVEASSTRGVLVLRNTSGSSSSSSGPTAAIPRPGGR
ncbi:hypothetical protein ACFWBF_27720 [Streptomyces sp. NPDC060028]|uniref:hypothetical protein n=1 Tax=Streptomyces sp. NPDC060028 TaxID=3347041 RepID=UPI0036B7330D